MVNAYVVIMAGGSGTRLWPVSRQKHPKHTLPLLGVQTLFQTTVERLNGLVSQDHILVVTTKEQVDELRKQVTYIPEDNFLIEPEPRGTASVVGLAATVLHKRDPEAMMAVLPSDHFIRHRDLFHLILRVAIDVAKEDYLVTLGITPSSPATGYGYIQRGDPLPEDFNYPVYQVRRFTEKPTENQAREMVSSGDHSWNSGMFVWRVARILDEISNQMPNLASALKAIDTAWGSKDQSSVLEEIWPDLPIETIDYGIMENAKEVAVLPASGLGWSDVGSWDSLFDVLPSDWDGNIVFSGHHFGFDTRGSLIYGNNDDKLVVTIGVDDLIIVDSKDVLLVCSKDQAQRVRQVVDNLKNSDRDRYL